MEEQREDKVSEIWDSFVGEWNKKDPLTLAYYDLVERTRVQVRGDADKTLAEENEEMRDNFERLVDEKGESLTPCDWLLVGIIKRVSLGELEHLLKKNPDEKIKGIYEKTGWYFLDRDFIRS
jgi:hypothetical protein